MLKKKHLKNKNESTYSQAGSFAQGMMTSRLKPGPGRGNLRQLEGQSTCNKTLHLVS